MEAGEEETEVTDTLLVAGADWEEVRVLSRRECDGSSPKEGGERR